MHDLVVDYYADGTREDKLAFELFFKAERLINEFDIDGAIQYLKKRFKQFRSSNFAFS